MGMKMGTEAASTHFYHIAVEAAWLQPPPVAAVSARNLNFINRKIP